MATKAKQSSTGSRSTAFVGGGASKKASKGFTFNKWAALATFIVVFGAIGAYFIYAGHASTVKISCPSHGGTTRGYTKWNCGFYTTAPVYAGHGSGVSTITANTLRRVGTIPAGTNWVLCQAYGATQRSGSYYNDVWAYTESNQGTWGWVNALYGRGGSNNGPFQNVPFCSGSFLGGNEPPGATSGGA